MVVMFISDCEVFKVFLATEALNLVVVGTTELFVLSRGLSVLLLPSLARFPAVPIRQLADNRLSSSHEALVYCAIEPSLLIALPYILLGRPVPPIPRRRSPSRLSKA